jgi:hypothetical protein
MVTYARMEFPTTVHPSQLPQVRREMDFLESSFFQSKQSSQRFPTPAEVRALSRIEKFRPLPVIMEHLNLLVKFGPQITVAEAQCLWLIRRILGDKVPVPEVYGWRVDGNEVFAYMQLVRGVPLKDRWEHLSTAEKTSVCEQLCEITTSLRQLKQEPSDQFIGMSHVNSKYKGTYDVF